MSHNQTKILNQLNQQAETAKESGNLGQAAAALSQKGLIYAHQKKWPASASAFDEVVHLTIEIGEASSQAMAYYGKGIALFQMPEKHQEAKQAFQQTAALAKEAGHRALSAKAHYLLHSFCLAEDDISGGIAQLTTALAQMDVETDPQLAVQIIQTRASIYFMIAQFKHAQTDLAQALTIAQNSGDKNLILAVQLDQQVLKNLTAANLDQADVLLESLLAQARQTGNQEIMGDVKLHQAIVHLRTNRLQPALRCAQAARRQALASTDHRRYMRYLIACLLLAQAHERSGNRPEVLAVLLTCKKTFEAALGQEAGQIVVIFLDALHYRWGPNALQKALQTYQQQHPAHPMGASC